MCFPSVCHSSITPITKAFSGLKKNINRIWTYIRANPKKIFFGVGVVFFVIWILFDDYGIMKRISMEIEHRSLLERLKVEQKKVLENELRIQNASLPDSIEKAARERYNFRKTGETLFIIREQ